MIDGNYLFLMGIFYMVWVAFCLIYGSMWQLPLAFVPIAIGTYFYFDTNEWAWVLSLPLLSIFVIDLNMVLSKPKFNGWVFYVNYLLVVPFIALLLFNFKELVKEERFFSAIFSFIFSFATIFFVGKFWVSDIILLAVNRLYLTERSSLVTEVTYRYSTGGRSKSFYAIITGLGTVEISGFLYVYLGFKNIGANDQLRISIKTGWLGVKYVSGFPKIISRSKS